MLTPRFQYPKTNYIVLRQADCLAEMRSNGSHLVPFPGTPHRVVSWVIEFDGVLGEAIFDMVQLEAGDHGQFRESLGVTGGDPADAGQSLGPLKQNRIEGRYRGVVGEQCDAAISDLGNEEVRARTGE